MAEVKKLILSFALLTTDVSCANPCGETKTHCSLMNAPRHYSDAGEDDADRYQRLFALANGVDAATDNLTERAWLITIARNESHLAAFVDLDLPKCREGHQGWCDGGKAYGVTQLQGITERNLTKEELFRVTLKSLRGRGQLCKQQGHDYYLGGTSLYATGKTCTWKGADARITQMWAIRRSL